MTFRSHTFQALRATFKERKAKKAAAEVEESALPRTIVLPQRTCGKECKGRRALSAAQS